ncbi:MAG: zinc ABC transporter substrate-binding protein [Clostridia bacterium]|nr:zinc ABC transporter substrate-binding protein [Clostridia bacterium]
MRAHKLVILLMAVLLLAGCAPETAPKQEGVLTVTATLFPQFDFAREVGGDLVSVELLLPPGVESHSYEPSPADIIAINECDVFLYTGEGMEPWAHTIAESLDGDMLVTDVSRGVELTCAHEEHEHEHHGHDHGAYDPHIWTDPTKAMIMVENIRDAFIARDPEHEAVYRENAQAYLAELAALDEALLALSASLTDHDIYFGGRFAMRYFAERYGFTCHAAYDSCAAETEPSARAVSEIIDGMTASHARAIYYEEMVKPTVALAIAEEVGAETLLLHSCHNVSRSEMEQGVTYLSLMEQNLANLKEGLSR